MNTDAQKEEDMEKSQEQVVKVAVDPEAEKREGIKESAHNSDVLAMEKEKAEVAEVVKADEPVSKPSFFVKKSARNIVEVDVLTSKKDGRVVSVSRTGLGIDFDKEFPYMVHTVLRFEFSLPNYEDMTTYRQRSGVYRREAQQVIVDKISLRNHLLVWHLKDWNVVDDEGKKVELSFDPSGALSDESSASAYALSPSLLDVVMTIYEKDALIA